MKATTLPNYDPVQRYPRNTSGRDFVVGDIHGCFTLLDTELAKLAFDPERDRLFSVGDLVDRGPESAVVLEAVHRHHIKAVRGNHEQGILNWVSNHKKSLAADRIQAVRASPDRAIADWAYRDMATLDLVQNGGQWFIEIYCAAEPVSKTAHRISDFFNALPYAIEIETAHGRIGIVHADVPFSCWDELAHALEHPVAGDATRALILWERHRWTGNDVYEYIDGVTTIIAGHTPTYDVAQRGNLINIDTAAVYGNKLTILNLDDVPDQLMQGDRPLTNKPSQATSGQHVARLQQMIKSDAPISRVQPASDRGS